ncbi:hypothetical protein AXG93_4382s1240 [Marchantia polymorpha subsp. ruderalis]|uniref:Uncharacterized protein n=1 Tax=Marchantia polymorpha subsp. ruderalis TaxID=1480154 RepID=A0A176VNM5_MARPO|nr:hypothetical protein AXG93_4382s1240 [Marchantia polymorpha subsp. ruderalis]
MDGGRQIPQKIKTYCGGGTYADSATVKNNLHGNMTAAEQQKFPLEREIAYDEGVMGVNEVASKEYNIGLAPPSVEANKSEKKLRNDQRRSDKNCRRP